MKKIFTYMSICLLAIITMLVVSCEKEKLSDVMVNEEVTSVAISLENKIEVGSGGDNFTLDNSELKVPITINLSGASGRAFNIQVSGDRDVIASLVEDGTLPAGTIPLADQTFNFPPVVDVAYGVKNASFDLAVSRSFLERNHDKIVALMVKISDPTKGNTVVSGKDESLVVINVAEAIAAEAVHYISFKPAGAPYMVPNGANYEIGSQDLTMPIELELSGEAGPDFTVDVSKSAEVVNEMIDNGTLKNAVALNTDDWAISNGKVKFLATKNSAIVNITARISQFLKTTDKKVAIGLTLRNPSKFQLNESKKTLVVIIDPDHFRPYNGTPFLIKGTIGEASDMIPAAEYDLGGEGVAFHDNDTKDGVKDYRPNDMVDVGDYTPRSVVGWTADNEWLTFSVDVEADGEYELNTLLGCPNNDGRYTIFFDGVDISGELSGHQTPGSYGDQQPNLSTVHLTKGKHIMKFFENRGAYDVRGFIFTRKN